MIVAYYDRIRKGLPLIEPDRSLSHAGNFLYMLTGERPSKVAEKALDVALSGFLVVNTIMAILAQQVKQIGIMKSIGALTPQIISLYLTGVLIYGIISLLVAEDGETQRKSCHASPLPHTR